MGEFLGAPRPPKHVEIDLVLFKSRRTVNNTRDLGHDFARALRSRQLSGDFNGMGFLYDPKGVCKRCVAALVIPERSLQVLRHIRIRILRENPGNLKKLHFKFLGVCPRLVSLLFVSEKLLSADFAIQSVPFVYFNSCAASHI